MIKWLDKIIILCLMVTKVTVTYVICQVDSNTKPIFTHTHTNTHTHTHREREREAGARRFISRSHQNHILEVLIQSK
jgi:hypothetical protein